MTRLQLSSQVFRALSHPARIRVLMMLRAGELCACQITAVLGLAPSTVSAHFAHLRQVGLVTERKVGRWVYYRLATTPAARATMEFVTRRLRRDDQIANDRRLVAELRLIPPAHLCAVDLDLARLPVSTTATPHQNEE